MAMMISKFHRLIQNKLTWWIILGVIVITFVFWGSQTGQMNDQAERDTALATLKGVPVDQSEFQQAYMFTRMSFTLQSGRKIEDSPQIEELIRKQAWQRIAVVREAQELGIAAGADELLPFIANAYSFFRTPQGQLNKQALDEFYGQVLPRMGFTPQNFDTFVREEIIIQKLGMMVVRGMLVTPAEARRMYHAMNDTFVVSYAMITPEQVEKSVKVGVAESRALYTKDPEAYTIPEKAVVSYVEFPVSNFLAAAAAAVTDSEVLNYYNTNLAEFEITPTNKAAATNGLTEQVQYKTQDEARPQIVSNLAFTTAARLAISNSAQFVELLNGTVKSDPLTFTAAAEKLGLKIGVTKPFAENEEVPGLFVGSQFNRAAFSLVEEDGGNVSRQIEGRDAIYILAYKGRIAKRVPTFDEVETNVLADARSQAIEDAMMALAKKGRDAMEAAAKAGQPVTAAAAKAGLVLTNTPPITAVGQHEDVPHFDDIRRTVLTHNAGEVTDIVPTRSGILVAHVAQRVSADLSIFEQSRPMITAQIRRSQGRQLFDGWQEYLLRRDKFEDLLRKATADAADKS